MNYKVVELAPRTETAGLVRERVTVRGMVQGVGFRPYVYRLAHKWGLSGFVRNEPQGVLMELEGEAGSIGGFFADFEPKKPPLAHISQVIRPDHKSIGPETIHHRIQPGRNGNPDPGFP